MSSAEVLEVTLDMVAAALDAPSKIDAIFDTRSLLTERGLDVDGLRRVAAALAVELVWRRDARKPVARGRLADWVEVYRLQVAVSMPGPVAEEVRSDG